MKLSEKDTEEKLKTSEWTSTILDQLFEAQETKVANWVFIKPKNFCTVTFVNSQQNTQKIFRTTEGICKLPVWARVKSTYNSSNWIQKKINKIQLQMGSSSKQVFLRKFAHLAMMTFKNSWTCYVPFYLCISCIICL